MLVVLMENQLLSPKAVCQSCLLADQAGKPRWDRGELRCGRHRLSTEQGQPLQYECYMGFRIAKID